MKEKITSFMIKYKTQLIILGVLIIIWAIWYFSRSTPSTSSGSKSLAQCLKDKGAKFYGASWCPHCKDQKASFGTDAINLPYVECSGPNRTQLKECADANIKTYPTWVFADGTRMSGYIPLAQLRDRSGC